MVDCPFFINVCRQCNRHFTFFGIAFAGSGDKFMAANWPHIAFVDYLFKLAVCTLFFLPAYVVLLKILTGRLTTLPEEDIRQTAALAEEHL